MKRQALATAIVALATLVAPAAGAAAQSMADVTDPHTAAFQAVQQRQAVDVSLRTHDDWAVTSSRAVLPLDVSVAAHDDWALTPQQAIVELDLSLRSHDDWAVRPTE